MLNKLHRLNKTKEIELVMKKGRAYYAPSLMMKILANNLGLTRFTVIVSNKVSKKATQRNLIKRRLREIIRLDLSKLDIGADAIILASPKIIDSRGKTKKYSEIETEVRGVFKKSGLWKK